VIVSATSLGRGSANFSHMEEASYRRVFKRYISVANSFDKDIKLERSKSLGQYGALADLSLHQDRLKTRRYEASSMCEKFALPRSLQLDVFVEAVSNGNVGRGHLPSATLSQKPITIAFARNQDCVLSHPPGV
jgi:predicted urease superfamily metal-dependent hydrolase